MLPVMIVRFYMGWFQMMLLDSAVDYRVVLVGFGVLHGRAPGLFPNNWKRGSCSCRR